MAINEGPNSLGKRQDQQEIEALARKKRVCKTPGCKTKLSSTNRREYCYQCIEGKTFASRISPPVIPQEVKEG